MSPEMSIPGAVILDESERITEMVLAVQREVQTAADSREGELLDGIRERLGYPAAEAASEDGLVDTRVEKELVITPGALAAVLPVTEHSAVATLEARQEVADVLTGRDDRLIVITGPCSIHDAKVALEYAEHVKEWKAEFGSSLAIIMRAYMEKPRTELGWKGLIYDPRLDDSDDINLGVVLTRMIAGQITASGVPIAVERLNASTPQYINGLVAYDAIGARNTTDQKAREYASGTSSPVGFKNTPEGSVKAAAEAVVAANGQHAFLGMGMNGLPNQVNTLGNALAHIILRGDQNGPNYSPDHVAAAKEILRKKDLLEAIIIDASHGNSVDGSGQKDAWRQIDVVLDVCEQLMLGETAIKGLMLESNLVGGAQKLGDPKELTYGQSITDECLGIDETEMMLSVLAQTVREKHSVRPKSAMTLTT